MTKGYFAGTPESYFNGLERFNLIEPQQRQWICDKSCEYHHKNNCPNASQITYSTFLEYLEMVRSKGKDYWKQLETRRHEEEPLQPIVYKSIEEGVSFFGPREI